MRVATYNIRNMVALDWASLWWRRRARLRVEVAQLDVDVLAMQEAYPWQIRWLAEHALQTPEWEVTGVGRNVGGRGEGVPLWHRAGTLRRLSDQTRWFGPTPDIPGSRIVGAQFPRIATIAHYALVADESRITVVNLHLDSASEENRAASIQQVTDWIALEAGTTPMIVLGDFNAPMSEPGFSILHEVGMTSALPDDAGPTSNGFGRGSENQMQIDHVFVSPHFEVTHAEVRTSAGYASDHYPVVVDLSLTPP